MVSKVFEPLKFYCNLITALVNALYPHNPAAVHDRLQDMFDGLEDMKDNERHIVTALFQTVSTKHPEVIGTKQALCDLP